MNEWRIKSRIIQERRLDARERKLRLEGGSFGYALAQRPTGIVSAHLDRDAVGDEPLNGRKQKNAQRREDKRRGRIRSHGFIFGGRDIINGHLRCVAPSLSRHHQPLPLSTHLVFQAAATMKQRAAEPETRTAGAFMYAANHDPGSAYRRRASRILD
jgi:hypothetical protein